MQQLRYRGTDVPDPSRLGHSLESRALIVMLCSLRQVAAGVKSKCLLLLTLLLQAAVMGQAKSQAQPEPLQVCIHDVAHTPHHVVLNFNESGMTRDLADLENLSERCAESWQKFAASDWCGHKCNSSMGLLSLWDFVAFLAWCKASASHAWADMVQDVFPKMVKYLGELLDGHGAFLAGGGLKPVPTLKTKDGNVRRLARINKALLLQRCKAQTRHREEVLRTHTDVTSGSQVGSGLVFGKSGQRICSHKANPNIMG